MISKVLSSSRYLIMVAVVCTFLMATTLFFYSGLVTLQLVFDTVTEAHVSVKGAKELLLHSIELVDFFLLSTLLYIISVGLYELFITDLELPKWLVITDLDMLKNKLIGVVIVVLAVLFLGQIVTWDGQKNILSMGLSISLVIGTLTFFLRQNNKNGDH